jgi:type IV pilus assembly protein PilB
MKRKRLGEVLQERGKISAANLQELFLEQGSKAIRLGELILERELVDKPSLIEALEEVCRVAYLDCSTVQCEKAALQAVPGALAERLAVLPIRIDHSTLIVAMAEPQNLSIIDELRFTSGKEISPRLAFRSEILAAIAWHYKQTESPAQAADMAPSQEGIKETGPEMEFISTSSRQANRDAIQEVQAELNHRKTPAVRLVSLIIQNAMSKQASDIHIEPQAAATVVRIRVDGVLRELASVPKNLQNSLISRIKILSDMDISERRAPQDGRFMVAVGPRKLDMRVSTLPTQFGEKVVMRLLEASAPLLSFADLGFPQDIADRISQLVSLPQGMILVTGPTGSGKSSTLYSALNLLRRPAVNIVTVEDPVEYALPGINQVHVNSRAGLTFASCLRSILRQDPNVIMVGEIRDLETAEIAMKAAQTGHLVLSTLHTNDSISAVVRLLDLGIPDYLIASSVTGILAQRLVRKLCSCHTFERLTPEYAARLAEAGSTQEPEKIAAARGCELCDHTGYKGRIGIYELIAIDESIRSVLRGSFKPDLLRNAARANGTRWTQEDALEKLYLGITTLEEIQRVVPFETVAPAECDECGRELMITFHFCPFCGIKRKTGGPASHSESPFVITNGALRYETIEKEQGLQRGAPRTTPAATSRDSHELRRQRRKHSTTPA